MLREAVNSSIGGFFMGSLFLGCLFLFYQIFTLNPVNPTSVVIIVSFTALGLFSGAVAARLVTQGELKVLSKKGEFTISNRTIMYAGAAGIAAFLLFSFAITMLSRAFVLSELFLLFAGLFTYFSTRAYLLIRWEGKNRKLVMIQPGTFTTSGKLCAYPLKKIET